MARQRAALFEQLYAEYAGMVHQLCLGFVRGRTQEADDLSQEVFVQVWRHLGEFRQEASAKTWLYRITVNACLQYTRKLERRRERELTTPDEVADGPTDHATDTVGSQLERLYAAIGTLPEIDRLIYMLTLEGQTNAQIADVTGLTPGALRVRIHRSRQTLRKKLTHAN